MLAAYRKLRGENRNARMISVASFSMVIMILVGINFDLRIGVGSPGIEQWIAFLVAQASCHVAIFGVLFGCWVLFRTAVLTPVVRETAKVTAMVFASLIGSQILNPVLIQVVGLGLLWMFLQVVTIVPALLRAG